MRVEANNFYVGSRIRVDEGLDSGPNKVTDRVANFCEKVTVVSSGVVFRICLGKYCLVPAICSVVRGRQEPVVGLI